MGNEQSNDETRSLWIRETEWDEKHRGMIANAIKEALTQLGVVGGSQSDEGCVVGQTMSTGTGVDPEENKCAVRCDYGYSRVNSTDDPLASPHVLCNIHPPLFHVSESDESSESVIASIIHGMSVTSESVETRSSQK